MVEYQPSLLPQEQLRTCDVSWAYNRTPDTLISQGELNVWKQRLHCFQQQIYSTPASAQGSLFAAAEIPTAEQIDPFTLPQRNAEFWREQFQDSGVPALYFVVDHQLPVLLYVGETVKSNQRWKGVHDCKRYILNYVAAHRIHSQEVSVNIGFWPYAPNERRPRQALELALIRRWRSPFNKENWTFWSTPFVG